MKPRISKIARIRGIGTGGLNTDSRAWELSEKHLTSGNNFRITAGAIATAGGHTRTGITMPPGFVPNFVFYVNAANDLWLVCGELSGTAKIYSYDGATWEDVTGPSLSALPDEWTGTQIGRIPVLNNPLDHPRAWATPAHGTAMVYLQWDAASNWEEAVKQCRSIRSFRSFLIAMNMTEDGFEQVDVVRWSHPADVGGLPVSWNESDPQYLAGKTVLGGDGGDIIDGKPLRDAMAIYRERGVSVLDFVGGDFIFNVRNLTTTATLVNTGSLAEVKGSHYYISEGDFVVTDGNTVTSLMHNRIRRLFLSEFDTESRHSAFVVHQRELKEIWVCIPTSRPAAAPADSAAIAYVYSYRDDTWSRRGLPDVKHADYGPLTFNQRTWDNWAPGSWADSQGFWQQGASTAFNHSVIGIIDARDGFAASLVNLDMTNELEVVETFVERTSMPLEDIHDIVSIQAVYPLIAGAAEVDITLGAQGTAGAPIQWKPTRRFYPGLGRKLDIRLTGELISWRVESVNGGRFTLTGLDLEYVDAGFR